MLLLNSCWVLYPGDLKTFHPMKDRRSAPWTEDGVDIHTNLLGVLVGVPHECQALGRNDGLWHLLPIMGPAIVDARQTAWINYIYYN